MEPRKVSYLISKFALQFCNELEKKNNIASPLSVEILLALLTLSSNNQTHDELLKALDFPDNDAIRSVFGYLKSLFDNTKGVTLKVANKLYLETKNHSLRPQVLKDAEKICRGGVESIDLDYKDAVAAKINAWVAEMTEGKISHIISAHQLTAESGLILLNAIYFKGSWINQFKTEWVKEWPFFIDNHTQTKVEMMTMAETYFRYGESEELNAKLLRMYYVGNEASMVVVLPHEIEGLDGMLQKLAAGHDLISDIEAMVSTELEIAIPKFKIEIDISLNELLPKLGIKAIFNSNNTDIKLVDESAETFVSIAKQKVIVEVNEEGSVAAACTSVMVEVRYCKPIRKNFIAWRPFLYMIMISDVVIFMGTYRGKT